MVHIPQALTGKRLKLRSPGVGPQPLEHPQGHVVAEWVHGNNQVRLVVGQALSKAPVARQVGQQLCPPPVCGVRGAVGSWSHVQKQRPPNKSAGGNSEREGRGPGDPTAQASNPYPVPGVAVDADAERVSRYIGTLLGREAVYFRAPKSRAPVSCLPRGREPRHVV